MFIDTHTHVYLDRFDEDRDAVIARAKDAGVAVMVLPAIDIQSIHDALDLSARYEGVYVMTALHPSETKDATDRDFQEVEALCGEEKVVAVGESGLDYYWDRSFDEVQKRFFRLHAQLAMAKELPLVIHNRDAGDDIISILEEECAAAGDRGSHLRGILHCFGGPVDLGKRATALGFHLGIGGTLTFKNSGVADVVSHFSLDQLVLETDSPFLAPVPHRGKRNEPAYVALVADRLARDRGLTVADVAAATSANARSIFGF